MIFTNYILRIKKKKKKKFATLTADTRVPEVSWDV